MPNVVSNAAHRRAETEEERSLRKKREYEKQRQEEKRRHMLKQSQATVLQKTQSMSSGMKVHSSMAGSRMAERKTAPLLGGDRVDNRLKKPTTFLCKLKYVLPLGKSLFSFVCIFTFNTKKYLIFTWNSDRQLPFILF